MASGERPNRLGPMDARFELRDDLTGGPHLFVRPDRHAAKELPIVYVFGHFYVEEVPIRLGPVGRRGRRGDPV